MGKFIYYPIPSAAIGILIVLVAYLHDKEEESHRCAHQLEEQPADHLSPFAN
ncbi:MAG: hypothetical protein ACLS8R_08290 [Anaeromassilibacillus sp.]